MSTRRSLLKLGLAGLFIPQGALTLQAGEDQSFETWRRAFEASVPTRMKAANVSGSAVAIVGKGLSKRYSAGFGFADIKQNRELAADTPMHLASVSKLFTASALVQLFSRRGLDLDRDINIYIDFPVRNPHHQRVAINPRHLLTHTSAFRMRVMAITPRWEIPPKASPTSCEIIF
ncbi:MULTISPECIES: serine hydrolase domain-containing protein [unclassified Mesorhizobium]|uniref:serine hydrolase domain-containing protein n=1 Tax=unclassified Mesorhizobium TaxID=325217 RepID=UPI0013E0AB65|nr:MULTISPECIES: serine hydrolase domain-containing protein [unclassified Mesorhizobium]